MQASVVRELAHVPGASPSFSATITSYDEGGQDHVSVVIPGNVGR